MPANNLMRHERPLSFVLMSFAVLFGGVCVFAACSSDEDVASSDGLTDGGRAHDARDPSSEDASPGQDAGDEVALDDAGPDGQAATTDDGGTDAGTAGGDAGGDEGDAGDAGAPLPEPGGPCSNVGEIYEKPCGKCGKQIASCSPNHVVTGFGACAEPVDACEPGTVEAAAPCGFCGTTTRTCSPSCMWTTSACQGEVTSADRCVAGEAVNRTQGCDDGTSRTWKCNEECTWLEPTLSCEEASRLIVIGDAVGATVSRVFTMRDDKIVRLASGYCPLLILGSSETNYIYLELRNPNPTPATAELFVRPTAGGGALKVLMAAYSSIPNTLDERKACLNYAGLGCANAAYSTCLQSPRGPTIPANGSVWVYVGNFNAADAAASFEFSATITKL